MILQHKLSDAPFVQAGTLRSPMSAPPSLLVVHYTATHGAAGVIAAFRARGAKVSAHLVIDVDGVVTQMVEFNRCAAHAGPSSWRGRPRCNEYSVGVELVNPGPMVLAKDGSSYVDTIAGKPWPAGVHEERRGSYGRWAVYPEAQLAALERVAREICLHYGIQDIAGHEDIAPGRKIDPGPAFPMADFRARVLGGES
jgi:N-acetylmuramoyl-L-alanine amidase